MNAVSKKRRGRPKGSPNKQKSKTVLGKEPPLSPAKNFALDLDLKGFHYKDLDICFSSETRPRAKAVSEFMKTTGAEKVKGDAARISVSHQTIANWRKRSDYRAKAVYRIGTQIADELKAISEAQESTFSPAPETPFKKNGKNDL